MGRMISKKDAEIISHLRNNARKKITEISREMNIPLTTVYDKIRVHENRFVKKHVSLIDFSKLGLYATANISVKVNKNSREALQKFLMECQNINSLYRTNLGSDYLIEGVFKNAAKIQDFTELLENKFHVKNIQIFNVIEELKKEEFLTKPEHFDSV